MKVLIIDGKGGMSSLEDQLDKAAEEIGGCGDPNCEGCGGDGSKVKEMLQAMINPPKPTLKTAIEALHEVSKKETDPVSGVFYGAMARIFESLPNQETATAKEIPIMDRVGLFLIMVAMLKYQAKEQIGEPLVHQMMVQSIYSLGSSLNVDPPKKSSMEIIDNVRKSIN